MGNVWGIISIHTNINARLFYINLAFYKYEYMYVHARLLILCCKSLRKLTRSWQLHSSRYQNLISPSLYQRFFSHINSVLDYFFIINLSHDRFFFFLFFFYTLHMARLRLLPHRPRFYMNKRPIIADGPTKCWLFTIFPRI